MFRWVTLCVFLCALTVGAVVGVSYLLQSPVTGGQPGEGPNDRGNGGGAANIPDGSADLSPSPVSRGLQPFAPNEHATALEYSAIPGGLVQPIYRLEVPAERDGRLMFLATEAKPGEVVPTDKKIVTEYWVVGFKTTKDANVPADQIVTVPFAEKGAVYRIWKPEDELPPGRLAVGYVTRTYRKLVEGDFVEAGDLLAIIETALDRDEVSSKLAKINAAQSEMETSKATKEEAKQRYDRMVSANGRQPGTYAPEEVSGANLTWQRYVQEERQKAEGLIVAQREASAAITILKKHEIRAEKRGEIKMIYKHAGEAVKTLDPVLQVQNPDYLRVEARLDVQDISKVEPGMQVTVEPTTPAAPARILSGHLQPVTCVAVSKAGPGKPAEELDYTIVSASEDRTVIGWDSRTGRQLWRLPQDSVVRAVACTGEGAVNNLLVIGGTDGSVRFLDLNHLNETMATYFAKRAEAVKKQEEMDKAKDDKDKFDSLKKERDGLLHEMDDLQKQMQPREADRRHQGAVLCAAFSTDGTVCATSGDDRTIDLWDAATGKLKGSIRAAHRAAVTSLQFTPSNQLVSAGRDNDLNVWNVEADGRTTKAGDSFDRRGGEVLQLGVSPDGKQVLFDQGKELLVLSLARRKAEGVLQNYGVSGSFTHMALFAPNGKTILTASAAEGRLQLWRTPTKDGRAGELRQFMWNPNALNTCGAFAPNSAFVVTGTQDHKVLVWKMPSEAEINDKVTGTVSRVDRSLNAGSTRQVPIWVDVDNSDPNKPRRLIIGSIATIVVPPAKP